MTLYRLLLRVFPASFRDEYGSELSRAFEAQRRDTAGLGVAWLWIVTIIDVLTNAARVHADMLRQDLRQTARTLRRTPGFTLTAIAITALGVGATTAAFTLTDHVLMRPLPFPDSDRLVKIWQGTTSRPATARGLQGTNDVSPALYLAWKSLSTSFESMGSYSFASSNLIDGGDPERLDGVTFTVSTFDTISAAPAIGRPLTSADDREGAPCAILISDGLWQRRFGAQTSVLGSRVRLDDESCEIAGVMPRGFDFPNRTTAFWRPVRFRADRASNFNDHFLKIIAKRKADVSFDQAKADLERVSAQLRATHPKEAEDVAAVMIDLRDEISPQSRTLLIAMTGAAICLLLIACTNLASLTIARASTRARELAVRTALGAGWRRLVRQLLTESLVIAVVGGGLGLALALTTIPMAARLVPTALPIAEVPGIDVRMLLIATIAALGTGIGFGVLPAFTAARRAAAGGMQESSRTGSGRTASRLRGALVATQVAASIVLLVGAGLLIRALLTVQAIPSGFDPAHVLTVRTFLPWERYGRQDVRTAFYARVLDEVSRQRGVAAAAYTSYLPMTVPGGVWAVVVPGRPVNPNANETAASRFVTPGYFKAMGIPLRSGRDIQPTDTPKAQPVAVVSESFVERYLDGGDAIGRTFDFFLAGTRTIVGVVGDVKFRGLERRNEPQVYLPYQQQGDNRTMGYTPKDLVVRLDPAQWDAGAADALVPEIRRIVKSADPEQPISDIQPLAAILQGQTTSRAVQVRVLGAFAVVSCLLAAVGLHGLLAFVVAARTREFGVRLALGARPMQILAMVTRHGAWLGLVGVIAGVAVAYAAGRWLESVLAGVSPADPLAFGIAIAVAVLMTIAGSIAPALRAARTDPRQAISDA